MTLSLIDRVMEQRTYVDTSTDQNLIDLNSEIPDIDGDIVLAKTTKKCDCRLHLIVIFKVVVEFILLAIAITISILYNTMDKHVKNLLLVFIVGIIFNIIITIFAYRIGKIITHLEEWAFGFGIAIILAIYIVLTT